MIDHLTNGELLLLGCLGGMAAAFLLAFGFIVLIAKMLFRTAMGRG